MSTELFIWHIAVGLDIVSTVFMWCLILWSFRVMKTNFRILKTDHFDIQITFVRILEAIERNRHDIAKINRELHTDIDEIVGRR